MRTLVFTLLLAGLASVSLVGCSSSQDLPVASIAMQENGPDNSDPKSPPSISRPQFSLVRLKTTAGDIVIKLDHQLAPKTVDNFLGYVRDGFYDETIIHHAAAGMIIGGGLTADLAFKPTRVPVINEATNGGQHKRGTIALARLPEETDSGTSQFFINLTDNPLFNHQGTEPATYGYAVFGEVIEGLEIAEKIGRGPTQSVGDFAAVPKEAVVIQTVVEEVLR